MKSTAIKKTSSINLSKKTGVSVSRLTETPVEVSIDDVVALLHKMGEPRDYVLKVVLAVYVSVFLENKSDPLWLLIVAPPSSNKTTIIDLMKDAPDTYRLDSLTANPFSSGQKEKDNPQDLLPLIDKKCLIVKDYTTIFSRSDEMVRQLIGDMVSIYDGEFSKHSPTRGTKRYFSTFSHIGCVTPHGLQKRQRYMQDVGARFLHLRLPDLNHEERTRVMKNIVEQGNGFEEAKRELTRILGLYCAGIRSKAASVHIQFSEEMNNTTMALADLVSRARSVLIMERNETEEEGESTSHYDPVSKQLESPGRALKQLRKLAECLAFIGGKTEVGPEELRILLKVAFSSMPIVRSDVLGAFFNDDAFTVSGLTQKLGKNERMVRRTLEELVLMEILEKSKGSNDRSATYCIAANLKAIFRDRPLPSPLPLG